MKKIRSVWPLAALLCALGGGVAQGVVYVPITDASLVDRSPIAVLATVVSFDSTGVSETAFHVSVERVLKGSVSTSEIEVMIPGSDTFVAVGMPRLLPGERWVLFLAEQPNGRYRLVELMLGAFREVSLRDSNETRAVRDLADATALGETATEPSRDFEAFALWVEGRASGAQEPGEYERPEAALVVETRRLESSPYTFLGSPPARWTQFDAGGTVPWVLGPGSSTLAAGGATAFQAALNAFNNESNTNMAFTFAGTNPSATGLSGTDGLHALLMNDPFNEIEGTYNCSQGGVLARGGFYTTGTNHTYKGSSHRTILEGIIVTQDGADCSLGLFSEAFAAQVLGHELGHAVGLGHSCGDAASGTCVPGTPQNDALMKASASASNRGATFSSDDVAALVRLYEGPPPTLAIGNVSATEGNAGTKSFVFTVTASRAGDQAITVSYATSNGSALAGSDYTTTTGTLTIPAGSTSGTITVPVLGDAILENNETFSLTLSNPTNATITTATGTGTIQNDDTGKTACASGCDFTKIQDAINASSAGGSILVRSTYDSTSAGEVFPIQTLSINQAGSITITGETDASGNPNTTVKIMSGPVDGFNIVSPGSVLQDLRIVPGDATRTNNVIAASRNPGSCPGATCHLNGLTIQNLVIDFTVIGGTSTAHFNTGNGLNLFADNVVIDKVSIKGIAGTSISVDGDNAAIRNSTLDGRDPGNANAIRGTLALGFGADRKLTGSACSGFPTNYVINANTLTGFKDGIQWCSGKNNTVSNNSITNISGKGIDTAGSQGSQIFGNTLQNPNTSATHGIVLSANSFQTCTGNTIRNNKVLGRFAAIDNPTIRDMQRGIDVQNCLETTIFQNEARDFVQDAIYVSMQSGVATRTTIQGNTLIGGNAAGITYFGADQGATAVDQSVIRDNVVNEFRKNGIVVQFIKGVRSGAGAGNVVAYNSVRAVNLGRSGDTHAFNLQNLANTAFDRNTALDTRTGFGFFLANATEVNGNCNTGSTNDAGLFGQVNVTPTYGNANVNCRVGLHTRYDFDGDGRSDITMYRHTTGQWFTKSSSTGTDSVIAFGNPGNDDIPAPGNYTTAGKTDQAIYRFTTGEWYIRRATDGGTTVITFGSPLVGDVPMPADYDGDGLTDLAVFRVSTANAEWYIRRSSDGATQYVAWGCAACADLGVPGDYDGDGKADVAVYRRSTGDWFIRKSSDTALQQVAYGNVAQGDIPVPGRYTQSSKTDMAVFRSLTGEWLIRRSTDFGTTTVQFGTPSAGDFPVSANFAQSGITDIAIYRPTPPTAQFMIRKSTDFTTLIIPYGNPGSQDAPLTAR